MARLSIPKCPSCGAPLELAPGVETVQCQYCDTRSVVQRFAQQHPGLSVVQPPQRMSIALLLTLVLGTVGLSVAGLVLSLVVGRQSVAARNGATQEDVPPIGVSLGGGDSSKLRVRSSPMLGDVDADGRPDIVTLCDETTPESFVCALRGQDGKLLWRSAKLTPEQADSSARVSVVGQQVIVVDSLGKLQAYSLRTGEPSWAGLLGEKARRVCARGGVLGILAADEQFHRFDLGTGKRVGSPESLPRARSHGALPGCDPVYTLRASESPTERIVGWSEFAQEGLAGLQHLPELNAHRALIAQGSKVRFMLGDKAKGSSVAMVAGVENGKSRWLEVVPGIDPLATKVNVTTQLASYAVGKLVVPYALRDNKGMRLACLEAQTGHRLWDVEIHSASQVDCGIVATSEFVYYASWTALYAFQLSDGKRVFTVGKSF